MKRGLNQSTLPLPTLSFDNQQAAAIPLRKDSHGTRIADDRRRVCDENLVHVLRVKEEVKMKGADLRIDLIPIVAVQRFVGSQKVVFDFVSQSKSQSPVPGTGRKRASHDCCSSVLCLGGLRCGGCLR